mgnify:FL=1
MMLLFDLLELMGEHFKSLIMLLLESLLPLPFNLGLRNLFLLALSHPLFGVQLVYRTLVQHWSLQANELR